MSDKDFLGTSMRIYLQMLLVCFKIIWCMDVLFLCHVQVQTSFDLRLSGTCRACQMYLPFIRILFEPVLLIRMH